MTVGVVIPVYNGASYIAEAIRSCISVTDLDEIIIIDDGSSDNSNEIIKSFSDSRIRLFQHPSGENRGRAAARNLGIANARSEWIIFCDADDWISASRLDFLIENSEKLAEGYYSHVGVHYESGIEPSDFQFPILIPPGIPPKGLLNYLIGHREEAIGLLGLTIRKEALIQIGLFDESLEIGEDSDLIWRLAHQFEMQYAGTNEFLATRRVHSNNTYQDQKRLNSGRYQFYKKWNKLIAKYQLDDIAKNRISKSYNYYKKVRRITRLKKLLPFQN